MQINKYLLATRLFTVVFLLTSGGWICAEERADSSWLNGKWEGPPPLGGELTMTLAVEKGNEVEGSGFIRQGGRKPARPDVTGTVNGNSVSLETFFPDAFPQARVHYDCTLIAGDLQCRTKNGYKTTFKKIE